MPKHINIKAILINIKNIILITLFSIVTGFSHVNNILLNHNADNNKKESINNPQKINNPLKDITAVILYQQTEEKVNKVNHN